MFSLTNSVKNKARLFFAIDISQSTKNQLEKIQQKNPVFAGRAVKVHNFHITLQFLGSLDRQKIPDLIDTIDSPGIKPFSLSLERYAYYPKAEVGCIEVVQGKDKLKEVRKRINQSIAQEGFFAPKEKHGFRPHVTLFRDCQPVGDLQQTLGIELKAEHFCLMESVQNEKGVYYEVLEEWPLYQPSIKEQFFGIKG